MILLRKNYQWTPADTKTDIPFSFECTEEIKEIRITFSFSPNALYGEKDCLLYIEKALTLYYDGQDRELEPMKASGFCPLKNLITISLSKEKKYLGNAHRWQDEQIHILTTKDASPGFIPPEHMAGKWEGMLHLHAVCTPECRGELTVEGRMEHAVVSC